MAGTAINSTSSLPPPPMLTSLQTLLEQQQQQSSNAVQLSSNISISDSNITTTTTTLSPHHLLLFSFNESILLWGSGSSSSDANHHQILPSNGSESISTTTADYFGLFSSGVGNEIEQFELVGKSCQHFLESLYSLTAFFALGGNLMTILVLALGRRSSRDLRYFLGNLALSDISMAAFSIPFTYTNFILGRWIWAPSWCPVVHAMQHVAVFVSIWTLVSIGVERYLNVTFLFRRLMPKTPVIIILIWLVGAALGTVVYVHSEAEPWTLVTETGSGGSSGQHSSTYTSTTINQTLYDCLERWENETDEALFTVCLFLAVFAIPLGILLFVYGSICYKLWHHSAPGNPNAIRDSAQSKAKIKSIKMLITICVLFAICWGPTHFFQLLRVLWRAAFNWLFVDTAARQAPLSGAPYIGTVITVHWMSMANSFCNPIIYCYMSDNFRADLKSLYRKYFNSRSSPSVVGPSGGGHGAQQSGYRTSSFSSSSSCLAYFCCCWCRKQTPAHRLTASTLVIEQLMLNSGGGNGAANGNGIAGQQNGFIYQRNQRNGHHYCNGNGLHLHFAGNGNHNHNPNNSSDWYPMTAMPPPPPSANGSRSNGLILQTAQIGGGGGGGGSGNGSIRSSNGRDQPIIEFRNGRAVKFKIKRASAPASSSGGGGGGGESGTSTSGGGGGGVADNNKTAKKSAKTKRSSSSARPYIYERNKWSRRSNTSRGGGGGNGNGGSSSSSGGGGGGVPRSATLNYAHMLKVAAASNR